MSEINQENQEFEMENVTPEDLAAQNEQIPAFVPSPKWKRVLAWSLFAVVALGIVFWLLGIANPMWIEQVTERLFGAK